MFINSEAIVPMLITMNILILLVCLVVTSLVIWGFRKLYKRMTGRDVSLPTLSAGALFILLATIIVVFLL